MKYTTRSILIARKKRTDLEDYNHRPCFISLFDENDPHLNVLGPKKVIEFDRKHKIVIEGLDVHYLLPGNDIVINNLSEIHIEESDELIKVFGSQGK